MEKPETIEIIKDLRERGFSWKDTAANLRYLGVIIEGHDLEVFMQSGAHLTRDDGAEIFCGARMSLRERMTAHRAEAEKIKILLSVRLEKLRAGFLGERIPADVVIPAYRKMTPGRLRQIADLEDASQVRLDPQVDRAGARPEIKIWEDRIKEAMTP